MGDEVPAPEVVKLMGDVADLILVDLDQLVAEMDAVEIEFSPALGADAAIAADLSASNRANVERILTMFARRGAEAPEIEIPPEALDMGRTVARRGIEFDVIFHAYRRGHGVAWQHYLALASRIAPSGPLLAQLLEISSQRMFAYVDQAISRVIATAQHEREEVLGGALARRSETIRLILDGAPIDSARASERLGYQLARRHTAMVLWAQPPGEIQGALEAAAAVLVRATGVRAPLTFSVGPSALWVWLGTVADPALEEMRGAIERVQPNIRVAVGPTLPGIVGFRRSHDAALAIQNLLVGYPGGTRLALHKDMEVTALAARDTARAAEFVAATLGPLAADTAAAARLRETLRIFLDEAENAPRAAARLHTHRNTVLQRVARATELLGRRPGEHRLATELALELAHQIGPRVLACDERN